METTFNGDLVWDHLGFATFTTINVEMDSILGCNNILLFRATASMDGWMLDSVSALFVAKHSHCIAEMPNECNEIEIPASSALETHTHTDQVRYQRLRRIRFGTGTQLHTRVAHYNFELVIGFGGSHGNIQNAIKLNARALGSDDFDYATKDWCTVLFASHTIEDTDWR